MIVVADAAPLIALSQIQQLHLLQAIYGRVHIPKSVYSEVVYAGSGQPGAKEIRSAEWVQVESVRDAIAAQLLQERLDAGESEAIVLALELKADLLLIDEARGRRIASAQGLAVTGTVGTLVVAKRQGFISAVKPLLDSLAGSGFRMSSALYQTILTLAEEQE